MLLADRASRVFRPWRRLAESDAEVARVEVVSAEDLPTDGRLTAAGGRSLRSRPAGSSPGGWTGRGRAARR